ncbi:hypothetical protein [Clostridium transplantifaecale]|uniref:hypothetical protein n=1 Tax=Clostridium transplantifaecale TaxID=2479838 RepID=UPI000F63CEF6|nr:hypothetical protein [Clostridium transplantifaecale]
MKHGIKSRIKKGLAVITVLSSGLLISACSAGSEAVQDFKEAAEEVKEAAEEAVPHVSGLFNSSTSYFDNYEEKWDGTVFRVQGEVHIAEDDNTGILTVNPQDDTEIHITGNFRKNKGEMRLVYEAPDGTSTVLAKSGTGENKQTDVDLPFTIKAGEGQFKLLGKNSVYTFDLTFTDIPPASINHSDSKIPGTAAGSFKGRYTDVTSPVVLMEADLKEAESVKVTARIHVKSNKSQKMVLGKFNLAYESSEGEIIPIIDHNAVETADGGYEWKDTFIKEGTLPAGSTKLVLSGIEGENYTIELDVTVKVK